MKVVKMGWVFRSVGDARNTYSIFVKRRPLRRPTMRKDTVNMDRMDIYF
jgi:hypothetical protein